MVPRAYVASARARRDINVVIKTTLTTQGKKIGFVVIHAIGRFRRHRRRRRRMQPDKKYSFTIVA
jgi:hypothetical protein